MRIVGICASLLAAAQFVMVSTPAFAAPADAQTATAAPADKKPSKGSRKKNPKKTEATAPAADAAPVAPKATSTKKVRGKKPKKGEMAPAAAAPAPEATPAPAPAPAPAAVPVGTTTLTQADVPVKAEDKSDKPEAKAEAKPEETKQDGMVEVHIDSPRAVTLEKRNAETNWARACDAPCDVKLGVSDEYRMVGEGLNESQPFHIDGSKGRVVLKVDPGTPGGQTRGLITTIGAGAALVGGIAVIAVGVKKHGSVDGDLSQNRNDGALLAGGALIMAGVVGGIVGTSWLIGNASTGVDGDVTKKTNEKAAPVGVTASRQPTWNSPNVVGVPSMTTVPVLTGSF
jgi:hypothetical protein